MWWFKVKRGGNSCDGGDSGFNGGNGFNSGNGLDPINIPIFNFSLSKKNLRFLVPIKF